MATAHRPTGSSSLSSSTISSSAGAGDGLSSSATPASASFSSRSFSATLSTFDEGSRELLAGISLALPITASGSKYEELCRALGLEMEDKVLIRALTQASISNEIWQLPSNERLEFLGDSVLGFLVAAHLYEAFPEMPEGELSKKKAALVNAKTLAAVARRLGLGPFILLGRGEKEQGGADKDSVLSDTFEAIIGAAYVSQGLRGAKVLVDRHIIPLLDESRRAAEAAAAAAAAAAGISVSTGGALAATFPGGSVMTAEGGSAGAAGGLAAAAAAAGAGGAAGGLPAGLPPILLGRIDSKTALQHYVQSRPALGRLSYNTTHVSGPSHKPLFTCTVMLEGSSMEESRATGGSKKEAESNAARLLLEHWGYPERDWK